MVKGVIVLEVFGVFLCFFLRPGSTVQCIYGFSLPKTMVNMLAKNLVTNLFKNQIKSLAKTSSDKVTENHSENMLKRSKQTP